MSSVRVAIPLLRGKRRFHLEKGRRWSIVEHIVLECLARKAHTAAEIAESGRMPRRLVIEILIRLMRAGWVELQAQPTRTTFHASPSGMAAAARPELPVVARPMTRWMNFLIDQITGTVFRPIEMPFLHKNAVLERAGRDPLIWLQPQVPATDYRISDLISRLFQDDETFISIDPAGDRLMERYSLVAVRNGRIESLPEIAPASLSDAVRQAAAKFQRAELLRPVIHSVPAVIATSIGTPPIRDLRIGSDDLLVGGAANAEGLRKIVRGARRRLLIHSTFVSERAFKDLLPELLDAGRRGARVDLMWGEGEDPRSSGRTRAAVGRLRESLAAAGHTELIHLHGFSTRSHAKFVVADRPSGGAIALLGSCNWLSSDMRMTEVSVRFREPLLIADLIYEAAELSRGRDGYWNDLTSELAAYAKEVATSPSATRANGRHKGSLLLGPQHRPIVLKAVEEARRRVFVTSHRVSAAARQAFIIPMRKWTEATGGAVNLRYGRRPEAPEPAWTSIVDGLDVARISVAERSDPELHAKLLGWDSDDIVITSQNWLSADPSENNPRRELGLHLHAAGIADVLWNELEKRKDERLENVA